uniref:Uncharacterized protein n=1 Tax=Anguilla anguilla TaxID=7936 RepID=A0A0E9R1P7_ANGAN
MQQAEMGSSEILAKESSSCNSFLLTLIFLHYTQLSQVD